MQQGQPSDTQTSVMAAVSDPLPVRVTSLVKADVDVEARSRSDFAAEYIGAASDCGYAALLDLTLRNKNTF